MCGNQSLLYWWETLTYEFQCNFIIDKASWTRGDQFSTQKRLVTCLPILFFSGGECKVENHLSKHFVQDITTTTSVLLHLLFMIRNVLGKTTFFHRCLTLKQLSEQDTNPLCDFLVVSVRKDLTKLISTSEKIITSTSIACNIKGHAVNWQYFKKMWERC